MCMRSDRVDASLKVRISLQRIVFLASKRTLDQLSMDIANVFLLRVTLLLTLIIRNLVTEARAVDWSLPTLLFECMMLMIIVGFDAFDCI